MRVVRRREEATLAIFGHDRIGDTGDQGVPRAQTDGDLSRLHEPESNETAGIVAREGEY